jgi:uncharacterized DUF497 family protein
MPSIEFDPTKDASNRAKHGLSLALAIELEWDTALVWRDARRDYGEARMVALAPRRAVVYCVVYVERLDTMRVISLRRANRRETLHYVARIENPSDPDTVP